MNEKVRVIELFLHLNFGNILFFIMTVLLTLSSHNNIFCNVFEKVNVFSEVSPSVNNLIATTRH